MDERRRLLIHGFLFLTISFALGLVTGAMASQHHPHARLWLGAHVTGLLTSVLVIALAVARPHLQLGAVASKVFFLAVVGGNWLAFAVLGVFGSLVGAPTPLTSPGLPPPAAWQSKLIGAALLVVIATSFTSAILGLWGLRRGTPGRP